ncbi:MAG: ATP-dependent RNA helicase HrpA [Halothiobacillaceae bacterium]
MHASRTPDPHSAPDILAFLRANLDQVRTVDRHRLLQRLKRLERSRGDLAADDSALQALVDDFEASAAVVATRRAGLPRPDYPPDLPVSQRREDILDTLAKHQVVILAGETGSGKTTQLPKMLLELGLGARGLVGHTQPRRLAARSVAARISEELGCELGETVGYKVRFTDRSSEHSVIQLMTDGILLAEMSRDRFLNRYEALIIDEAHERSLNIDFLLGYLRQLLPRRPDLKLIITSATLDPERFARHFADRNGQPAPVLTVSGRSYPVEVRYRPLAGEDEDDRDRDLPEAIADAVDELAAEGPGDILVFLPGEREIRETAEVLRKHHPRHTEILPLYARLSNAEQQRIFAPHGGRRVVLATNVAETSLTVPGIHYVIDSGLARVLRYSPRSRVQRLQVEPVSQASANQRAGRCGRLAPGVCIRLYDEADFLARPEFTDPEIRRSNLASVILRLEDLRLGHPEDFPFVDPPDTRQIQDARQLLFELGAMDARRRVTVAGRQLARLPIDPRLGRMLLAPESAQAREDALVVVAFLAIQDPRERPAERRQAADQAHARFRSEGSDFGAVLKLWTYYHDRARHLSQNKLRALCKDEFLSYVRMREWHELVGQLRAILHDLTDTPRHPPDHPARPVTDPAEIEVETGRLDALHRALLAGLLTHVGLRDEEARKKARNKAGGKPQPVFYLGTRNRRFHLFPGSSLAKTPPKWVMGVEIVETGRVYARMNAAINPRWIEPMAGHLVTRSHSEPHWDADRQRVDALETVTLFGLPIVTRRRVDFGRVDPVAAREIFIRRALVEGEYRTNARFFRQNRALIDEIRAMEAKARRPDILVDDETLFDFYDARIPADVHSGAGFEKWRRKAEAQDPAVLELTREMLMQREAGEVSAGRFPDQLRFGDLVLPLHYHFAPGAEDDGVTLRIPLAVLNQVDADRCQWLVPGLLEEKITGLIRSLPKSLRRQFVPAPEFARAVFERLAGQPPDGPLTDAVARVLRQMTGSELPQDAFDVSALDPHLLMRFEVVDDRGKPRAAGRDLEALRRRHAREAERDFARKSAAALDREDIQAWDFGPLPKTVTLEQAGAQLTGYPALIDQGDRVALKILDTAAAAQQAHRAGLTRLFLLALPQTVKALRQSLPLETACLQFAQVKARGPEQPHPPQWPFKPCDALKMQVIFKAADNAIAPQIDQIRDADAFEAMRAQLEQSLPAAAEALAGQVSTVLAHHHELRVRIKGRLPLSMIEAAREIGEQMDALIFQGFVWHTPADRLPELPRYIQAAERRLEKIERQPDRDRLLRVQFMPLAEKFQALAARGESDPAVIESLRWQLEELRVSLFAQELGVRDPVSVGKLERQLNAL